MLVQLHASGVVARLAAHLRMARRGGFDGVEAFAFAALFLSAGHQSSIRAFCERHQRHLGPLGGLVGRRTLPSSAALSRVLGDVTQGFADGFADSALEAHPGFYELLRNQTVQHRDAVGRFWHIFDFDPSTRGFRQRGLIGDSEHPDAVRRAIGVPGHMARKRGEIRQQDHMLRHAGSGLWCHYRLNAEGGTSAPYLCRAAEAARRIVDRVGHPAVETLLRADGEFGHLAAVRGCVDQGLHFLMRVARYHLFGREEVQEALRNARWKAVPGMPGKQATDLGVLRLHDSKGELEPVECRVVVTRQRIGSDETPDHGIVRDGFQLETFATSLPADAWPAEDLICLYNDRTTAENAFAELDRVYEIDRTFSFNPPGQQLFITVALVLWNHCICHAAQISPPKQVHRQVRRGEADTAESNAVVVEVPMDVASEEASGMEPDRTVESLTAPIPPADAPITPARERFRAQLAAVGRARLLPEGWTFSAEGGHVRCAGGQRLDPNFIERTSTGGQSRVRLRTSMGACAACPLRMDCFPGATERNYKQITWRVSPEQADVLHTAFVAMKVGRPRSRVPHAAAPLPSVAPSNPARNLFSASARLAAGPWIPALPSFAPAKARTRTAAALPTVQVTLIPGRRRRRRRSADLTTAPQDRACRRLSWAERAARRSCTQIQVIITASRHARRALAF